VKGRGVIVGLLMVGLALGAIVGGWIGGIVGGHQADAAEVAGECYLEGCGFMVVGYAFFGIILGGDSWRDPRRSGWRLAEFAAPMNSSSYGTGDPPPVWIGLGRSGDGYCA
jgi:hypothetical protein